MIKILEEDGKPTQEPVGSVEDIVIAGPAGDLSVRVYKPAGAGAEPLPVILWVHGGGWVLFTVDTYDASCRGLVNKTGAIVVSPEYRRAPEDVFPRLTTTSSPPTGGSSPTRRGSAGTRPGWRSAGNQSAEPWPRRPAGSSRAPASSCRSGRCWSTR